VVIDERPHADVTVAEIEWMHGVGGGAAGRGRQRAGARGRARRDQSPTDYAGGVEHQPQQAASVQTARPSGPRAALGRLPRITRPDRGTWVQIGLVLAFFAFYVWISDSSMGFRWTTGSDGILGRLADSLLHGRATLGDAPRGLRDLPNPYDPAANAPYRGMGLHDLSLYKGRLYAYWGPTASVVLFAPARLLGLSFPEPLAASLFTAFGFLFSVLLLRNLVRRFAPAAPAWQVNAGIVLLGLTNAAPYMLRRSAVYEVAIGSGLCFAMAAAWLLVSGAQRERRSLVRLALGSLCLGLAVGARPSHIVTTVVLLLLTAWSCRDAKGRERLRVAAAVVIPVGICAVLLAGYNAMRFDSFTEFGLSYQMAGVDVTVRDGFRLAYLPPGLWYFLVAPARWILLFPFVNLAPPPYYPGHIPPLYDGVEPTGGLLFLCPLIFVLLAVPWLRWRGHLRDGLGSVVLGLAAAAAGLVCVAAVAFWGATMRYEVDFASWAVIAALLVWLRLTAVTRRRRLVKISGSVLIAWSVLLGVAVSFTGQYTVLRSSHPKLWESLTKDFSPLSRLTAAIDGGPSIGEVVAPLGLERPYVPNYLEPGDVRTSFLVGAGGPANVRLVLPKAATVVLRFGVLQAPGAVAGGRTRVVLHHAGVPDVVLHAGAVRRDVRVALALPGGIQDVIVSGRGQSSPANPVVARIEDLRVTSK
jgi:hypothetical protein